jgi:hypothetical protein
MIRSIRLTLNSESKHITNVTIQEDGGDEIVITFLREQWNAELDENLFAAQ